MSLATQPVLNTVEIKPPGRFRIPAIDILRGLVMVIMALDHTRDFLSDAKFDPTDLAHTTPLLFFTRWITHFCAPVFVFLAGSGAALSLANGKTAKQLSGFLLTRGLWLVFLEVCFVTPFGWAFSLQYAFTRMQVIWVIGASMVVLSMLVRPLKPAAIGILGLVIVVAGNLFDGPHSAWLGPLAGTWQAIHGLEFFPIAPHKIVGILYPLLPWFGILAAGYGFGGFLSEDVESRKKWLWKAGLACIGVFILLRGFNLYGDPKPWDARSSGLFTVMSFLNCTKYPPSLLYVLMTLGPALCFLAFADRLPALVRNRLAVFGRVPLFYYLLHLPLLHGVAVLFSYLRYGQAPWMFQDAMAIRNSAHPLPADYGYDLWVVYAVWIGAVLALYPLCSRYGNLKRKSRNPLLGYL